MALRSPSSSSFSYGFTYEVFLSFKGTDTRFGFTGNLYKALCDAGIHTFIDDRELQGGDEITSSLVKAIEESRIAIPVFSKNYASSSFCLDELVHIIECVKEKGRLVLPVFYDVDPSQVRHHNTGSYGEAIAKHEARFKNNKENYTENMERLKKWKMALNQVANLAGRHFKLGSDYEYQFIGKIVEEVSNKITSPSYVADYPIVLEFPPYPPDVGFDDGVYIVGGVGNIAGYLPPCNNGFIPAEAPNSWNSDCGSSRCEVWAPLCYCGDRAILRIANTAANPRRRFWGCSHFMSCDRDRACNFLEWCPEDV